MSYLYVNEQDARIGVDGGYITVQMKNDLLRKIPSETLENISLFGNISITTQAMQRCLKLGITLNFFSSNGRYYGHFDSDCPMPDHKTAKTIRCNGRRPLLSGFYKRNIRS